MCRRFIDWFLIRLELQQIFFSPSTMSRPVFEGVNIPGKGKGLVARVHIPRGTRILLENPLFSHYGVPEGMEILDEWERAIAQKLWDLPDQQQQQSLPRWRFTTTTQTSPTGHRSGFSEATQYLMAPSHKCPAAQLFSACFPLHPSSITAAHPMPTASDTGAMGPEPFTH